MRIKEDYLIEDILQRNFQNGVLERRKDALGLDFFELSNKWMNLTPKQPPSVAEQTKFEEYLNAISHGVGAILGLIGLGLLITYDTSKTTWSLFSVVVYGLSIIILFTASTLYHAVSNPKHKHYYRIVDHISIYLLIAGTYTPILLITLEDSIGWMLFCFMWSLALIGMILKLFFTGRFEIFQCYCI